MSLTGGEMKACLSYIDCHDILKDLVKQYSCKLCNLVKGFLMYTINKIMIDKFSCKQFVVGMLNDSGLTLLFDIELSIVVTCECMVVGTNYVSCFGWDDVLEA